MAVSCDPSSLVEDARCIDSCIPEGMQMSVLISIFCQLAGMSCDPSTLINDARCIDSCIPPGYRMSVLISLACQLLEGGGGQEVFVGHYGNVAPVFVAPLNRGVAYDLDAPFQTFKWNPDTQAWE